MVEHSYSNNRDLHADLLVHSYININKIKQKRALMSRGMS